MIKKLAALILCSGVVFSAFGQETQKTRGSYQPDIPGTFVLELGTNHALSAPDSFNTGFWGSRSLNIYYQYDIRILKSNFSFVPGIGLSLERYKFKDGNVLAYNGDSLSMLSPTQVGLSPIKKSMLITNYIEIPLEICYRTNPDDPARSFKASVGVRGGYLFDSFTKVKYKQDGEMKKVKNKEDFELSKFRYGFSAKIGIGNFSLFGYYNHIPLFEKDKGPVQAGQPTEFNTFTVGISLSSF